ncbi:MAG: RcnB family protein [Rhodanobacter sp.]
MKKQLGMIALCGAMLVSSQVALAQAYPQAYRPGPPPPPPQQNRYKGMYDQGRHEGWYKKGGRIPQSYRSSRYVVGAQDWKRYRLKAPPRGYQYVRSDNGDFLLTAIATGVITSIILANH